LLRDVLHVNFTSLTNDIVQRHSGLSLFPSFPASISLLSHFFLSAAFNVFTQHVEQIHSYLRDVLAGKLPLNQQVFFLLQEVFAVPRLLVPIPLLIFASAPLLSPLLLPPTPCFFHRLADIQPDA
jgi:hypothetical protein